MKIIDPGHSYDLFILDDTGDRFWPLMFLKREGKNYPGNIGHHGGVNCQEVLRVLIDRVKYLQYQIPCVENEEILRNLRETLYYFEFRATARHNLDPPDVDIDKIETYPTCETCGHIQCDNKDHKNAKLNKQHL